jgi:hypothetical protein
MSGVICLAIFAPDPALEVLLVLSKVMKEAGSEGEVSAVKLVPEYASASGSPN